MTTVFALLVHLALRVVGILWAGLRLLLILAPFLAVAAAVEWAPGLSRELRDFVAISAGFGGLGFVGWLALARPPRPGAPASLRYRYARLVGMDPRRRSS